MNRFLTKLHTVNTLVTATSIMFRIFYGLKRALHMTFRGMVLFQLPGDFLSL